LFHKFTAEIWHYFHCFDKVQWHIARKISGMQMYMYHMAYSDGVGTILCRC